MSKQFTVLGAVGAAAQHGISELAHIVQRTGFSGRIAAGTIKGSEEMRGYAAQGLVVVDEEPEALGVGVREDEIIVAGYDDTGLMYACLALGEILEKKLPLESFHEKPFLSTRGIYELPHNRDLESERFYSKDYWVEYFNMLARCRINYFHYVFSHQTSYLAPVFAYFLRDEKYPQVKPTDIDAETIDKNYRMMEFITRLAHERGITFILGIWQVRPWPSAPWECGRNPQPCNIEGLTQDILEDYTYRGARAMLEKFQIDGIQVRVNNESGIHPDMQTEFFKNSIFKAVSEAGRLMDYRGWMARPETTQAVKEMCPNLRASMKYWAEFLGAPYQPCKIEPGYSYGNLLEKPMPYRFMWQVWSLGSPRLLLWGDPEYVRRFVHTCRLGGAEGFEINPLLAQKGYSNEPGYWRIFKNTENEYYTHEYERYWMFYLLFGRMAYNPSLSEDIWLRELEARVGSGATRSIMRAYSLSSRVITFLVQYSLSDPNMYIWPEIDTGGLLEFYLETPTSDECVISTIPEYVKNQLSGAPCGKLTPHQSSQLFRSWSDEILSELEKCPVDSQNKELLSASCDFRIMAFLARYHSLKIEAGILLETYFQSGDGSALADARKIMREATACWERLVRESEDVYYDDMVTGPSNAGSWKRRLPLVYDDELRLAEIDEIHKHYGLFFKGFDFGKHDNIQKYENNRPRSSVLLGGFTVERGFLGVHDDTRYDSVSGYGFTAGDIDGVTLERPRLTDKATDMAFRRDAIYEVRMDHLKGYRTPLYGDYLMGFGRAEFQCDLPDGEYCVTAVFCDRSAAARPHGPFDMLVNGREVVSGLRVMPFELVEKTFPISVFDGRLRLELLSGSEGEWFITAVVIKKAPPAIAHMPVRNISAGEKAVLTATVTTPAGLPDDVSVVVDGAAVPMEYVGDGHYRSDITGLLSPDRTTKYKITAVRAGTVAESDSVELAVHEPSGIFTMNHTPSAETKAGEDLEIKLGVSPQEQIKEVNLYYSQVNQMIPLEKVAMKPDGNRYSAVVPGAYITGKHDLLYYFEVNGKNGHGMIYPDFQKQTPYYVVEVI